MRVGIVIKASFPPSLCCRFNFPGSGRDVGRMDAGMDVGMDAGRDAGIDVGMDVGREVGGDALRDAGRWYGQRIVRPPSDCAKPNGNCIKSGQFRRVWQILRN